MIITLMVLVVKTSVLTIQTNKSYFYVEAFTSSHHNNNKIDHVGLPKLVSLNNSKK